MPTTTTPRVLGKDTTNPANKQVQFLENKVNRLRHMNDSLSREVFDAIQRGHRLAAKLGFQDLDDAERSLATQADRGGEEQHSQLEQLSQYPSEELAGHVQALQAELVSHVQLSKSALNALQDALDEIAERVEMSGGGHGQGAAQELAFVRTELDTLKQRYTDLREAKEKAEQKHAEDLNTWRAFKEYYDKRAAQRQDSRKRRKLDPEGDVDEGGTGDSRGNKGEGSSAVALKVRRSKTPTMDRIHQKSRTKTRRSRSGLTTPARPSQEHPPHPVLTSKDTNSSSPTPTSSTTNTPTKRRDIKPLPHKAIKREPSVVIPEVDELPGSSDTEPDSQPVKFFYPSHQDVVDVPPSTAPQKQARSPAPDRDSSQTDLESQGPAFLYPPEIVPLTPAQVADMTPKPRPGLRRERQQQLHTPVSIARPQPAGRGKERMKLEAGDHASAMFSLKSDRFREHAPPAVRDTKSHLPDTPVSLPTRKGKERAVENDENALDSTGSAPSTPSKKHPSDYIIYKGRGRYGAELQAGKKTINAMYEINPEHNNGVNFQFEEVVRDKGKRKQMHGADCECCRDYYEAIGPLPSRLQPPMWRSPQSKGKKRPRDSFEDDEDDADAAAIEEHKQTISRHRQHWARGMTPPGYWNIGFPDTQEVEELNAEAQRMHERKRAMVAQEAQ
ncbi:DNA repair protein endonuclease SAE2/CtIP C-terminus-domain-containing protein [Cerioporus squamosus]|nr:DNA repair protein endonuclease SAE2/CtIP C-terminus-domain-containing protein [Cerioporus squamosus]